VDKFKKGDLVIRIGADYSENININVGSLLVIGKQETSSIVSVAHDGSSYRMHTKYLELVQRDAKPHVHAELIKAWSMGAIIEVQVSSYEWLITDAPMWESGYTYRIKPCKPKETPQQIEIREIRKYIEIATEKLKELENK